MRPNQRRVPPPASPDLACEHQARNLPTVRVKAPRRNTNRLPAGTPAPRPGPCELSDHGERLSIILGIFDTGCPDPVPALALRAGHGCHVADLPAKGNP
jgi:hypothetical protein